MYSILICDDDSDIAAALEIYLKAEGYRTLRAANGREALDVASRETVHLALMDIMMPGMDGIAATVQLREQYNFPIILLTAKSEDSDKVLGLTLGADDYVTKPFNPMEVLARVKSQLRRYTLLGGLSERPELLVCRDIVLDDAQKRVTQGGEEVSLTPIEYSILKLLMENRNRVFSSRQIYESVWNDAAYGAENTVAVHIRHLREKLEIDPANPRVLKVVWGHGYKLSDEG
ncbi:MAG: response regulator transcription factor [Clostridium sp.]|nr:response regulator transcription factor [Clostridium sp.]MDD7139936.1 response regulator transcription factor [Clostridium sp.]MDO4342950.1 response regulator transcription factor [Eubacteriales bacterium]MDY6081476.1 response regulator transcription factor [Eubacteriales bacterium]